MKNIAPVILLMLGLSLIISCTHQPFVTPSNKNNSGGDDDNSVNNNSNTNNNSTVIDTGVCFQRDILPIFVSNCAKSGCHDATTQAEDLILNSYTGIMNGGITPGNASGSRLYRSLSGTNPYMPPSGNTPLTASQQAMIQSWINAGAPNDTNCTSSCDTTKFSFAAVVNPILSTNCVGCHNSRSAGGGVTLDTYAGVQTVALNGKLVGAINGTAPNIQMPLGGNKLMSCQITRITKWVNAGAPNN